VRARILLVAALAAAALAAAPAAEAKAPKRIVALTPFTANVVTGLGVVPIAVGETLGGRDRLVRRLRNVRTLPLSHPNGPNLEQLATLNPQLVFSSPTWRRGHAAIRSLRIKVVESDPRSVREAWTQIRRIGRVIGKAKGARQFADVLERRVARARRKIRKHPRVLLVLGVGRTPYAFLKNSWGGDLVAKAGGRLITGGLKASGGFARVSDETIVARDPDVIIAVPHADADDIPGIAKYLKSNPAWASTRASRSGRIYVSTDNSLLQAGTDPDRVIKRIRSKYLKN
jgi:iron complex transport system substrate-binding protein